MVQLIIRFLISVVLSEQYRGGKAIPVAMSAGGNFITNECKKFSDTNLTDVIRRKFNPKFFVQYSK